MEAQFHDLLAWIGANPGWAYLAVFLIALSESLAVVGLAVPGVVFMVGAGALIATGSLQFWPTCLSAIAGAIAGDGLSYWLGWRFKDRIRTFWPFSRHPESLDRGVAFFERYGGKSVALGRFFGPVRAIVPLVAGMLRMDPRRFLVANVLSAIAWAPAYLLPGIVFGASMKLAAEAALGLVVLGLILIGVVWVCFWAARRLYALLGPRAAVWVQQLLRWADVHPGTGKIARALADPAHPDAGTLTAFAFLLVLGFFLSGGLIGLTLVGAPGLTLNQAALDLGHSLQTPAGDRLMLALGSLGDALVVVPMTLVVYLYLRRRGRLRHAVYWLAATGFALIVTPVLGFLLRVPRPVGEPLGLLPWSFPSGPVLLATAAYGFLAVSVARGMPASWRWAPYASATALVGAVSLARVYLGAEWLTDVLASIALGLAWIATLGLAFRRHSRLDPRWSALSAVAVMALAASLAINGLIGRDQVVVPFGADLPVVEQTRTDWLAGGWQRLPQVREGLRRMDRHPMTLQYAGDLAGLAAALAPSGWTPADPLGWKSAIRLLSPSQPIAELPLIPHVHDGRHEQLALVKDTDGERRLVLRLWATGFRLEDGMPLWVGNVSAQRKEGIAGLAALPITEPVESGPLAVLTRDLEGRLDLIRPVDSGPLLIIGQRH